jgi:hypothetical protein
MGMEKETYYMICFDSSQRAIHMERKLAAEFAGLRLVPIPPEIRASCGLGIKVSMEQFSSLKERILEEQIFLVTREGSKRSVEPWKTE